MEGRLDETNGGSATKSQQMVSKGDKINIGLAGYLSKISILYYYIYGTSSYENNYKRLSLSWIQPNKSHESWSCHRNPALRLQLLTLFVSVSYRNIRP